MLNFTGLKIRGNALIKLAKLTAENDEQKAQETYNQLKKLSDNLDYDLLLELDDKEAIVVSKLSPLTEDTVEITRNNNFVQGMKEAIKTLETENTDMQKQFLSADLNRHRIIAQIRNVT